MTRDGTPMTGMSARAVLRGRKLALCGDLPGDRRSLRLGWCAHPTDQRPSHHAPPKNTKPKITRTPTTNGIIVEPLITALRWTADVVRSSAGRVARPSQGCAKDWSTGNRIVVPSRLSTVPELSVTVSRG